MAANLGFFIRGSFEKASDKSIDVEIEGIRVDRNKVGQACDSMRANFCVEVFSEHDELWDHEVKGKGPVDLDIEFPRIILTRFFEYIKSSLGKSDKANSVISGVDAQQHAGRKIAQFPYGFTPCAL
jgi:hypothetical protein